MAEDFYSVLMQTLRREAERAPRSGVDPRAVEALFQAARPSAPPPKPAPEPRAAFIPPPVPAAAPSRIRFINEVPAPEVSQLDWEALEASCRACRACPLCEKRTRVVFGEGNRKARLMFIGEGPGGEEDRQGRPFVGPAGQLLDKMIGAMGLAREDVYIGNIVKCRPPGNRDPEPEEAARCMGYLRRQIALVAPEVIITLGRIPLFFLLGRREGITQMHGRWQAAEGIPVMPTFHPAFLLRQESAKRDAWSDLKKVMQALNLPIKPTNRSVQQ